MRTQARPTLLALVAMLTALAHVRAQTRAQDQPVSAALGGPTVAPQPRPASLVERDFDGKVRRLDQSPEEAALALLDFDEHSSAECARILRERAAILDKVVAENIELLLKLTTAAAADDRPDMGQLSRELRGHLAPLRERGRTRDELAAAMPEDRATRFRSLVDEYWRAVTNEEWQKASQTDPRARRGQVYARLLAGATGAEIRRSYDRQVATRLAELEALLEGLALSPEQEGAIRSLLSDFGQKYLGKATAEQKRDLFTAVARLLTEEQRRKLVREFFVGRSAG